MFYKLNYIRTQAPINLLFLFVDIYKDFLSATGKVLATKYLKNVGSKICLIQSDKMFSEESFSLCYGASVIMFFP